MKKSVKINFVLLFVFAIIGAISISCDEELYVTEVVDSPPVIASFSPNTGLNGTLITVQGQYLKNVDSASFGDGQAMLHRVVNDSEIVLKVTNASKSGAITVKNSKGEAKSSESFTMQYVTPAPVEWPSEQEINQDVSILGTNLESVTRVYFTSPASTEKSEALIVYLSGNELAVQVPYVEADWANVESTRATITLVYATENGEMEIPGPSNTFVAKKPPFEVTSWPTAALAGSEVNILGTNVGLANEVYFGDQLAQITKATAYSLTVEVPDFQERTFVNMKVVYFRTLVDSSLIKTEVYTQYRKTIGNGSLTSMVQRADRVSPGVEIQLIQSTDTPLVAPEGAFYTSYYSQPDPAFKSSVPLYFNYDEGDGNTINLNAFEEPVLHFYYYNDSTPAYLQLEVVMGGSNMRLYIERYRTNRTEWELVCIRLDKAEFGTGYDGPFAPLPWKDAYEALHINYKPSDKYDTQFHIDNVFISEGAISGAIDLTRHTKENDHEISIVE